MIENNALEIKEIAYGSEAYTEELELRDVVLRKPLGMTVYDDNLKADEHDIHLGAFINNRLVGVLILNFLNVEEVRMRQVAVDETWQKKKIGSQMVIYAELLAKNKGCSQMLLHARKSAVVFYKKMGYAVVGDEFLEINIPHYNMRKWLVEKQ